MDENLRKALELLVAKNDAGEIFDRLADEGGYRSEELDRAMAVIERELSRD